MKQQLSKAHSLKDVWRNNQFYILALLLVGSRVFLSLSLAYTMDDAFITFRYAQNLALGEGFVYNYGERVQGTSTPLYTLMLAGLGSLTGTDHIPAASRIIALIADIFSLAILWKLLSSLSNVARFMTCGLFAAYPKVVLVSISGMETSLVVLLMLASYVLLFDLKRTGPAFLVFSLLLLCRMDGAIWVAVCLWRVGWSEVKGSLRFALLGLGVIAAWFVFSQFYFGTLLPHSVIAKSVSYVHEFPWFDPVRILVGYFPFEGFKGQSFILQAVAVIALLAPVIVELVRLPKRRSVLSVFPMFFIAYNVVFSFGRTIMVDWYYLPGYIALFFTIGSWADDLAKRLKGMRFATLLKRSVSPAFVLGLVILLILGASRWQKSLVGFHINQNIPLGKWLHGHGGKKAQVLVEPIGYIGWISDSYIHDFIGLVSPSIVQARRRTLGSDAWFMQYVMEKCPEFIVLRDWEITTNRLFRGFGDGVFRSDRERNWFWSNYAQIDWNPESVWHEPGALVLFQNVNKGVR